LSSVSVTSTVFVLVSIDTDSIESESWSTWWMNWL